jgi:hypothetical protein
MTTISRGRAAIAAAVALLASAAALAAPVMTASAAATPPCTADSQHHCLALTNYTNQTISFAVSRRFTDKIGCFTVNAKQRKVYPNVYLLNGDIISIGLYTSTHDQCDTSNSSGGKYLGLMQPITIDQPTKYEWIDYR